MQSLGRQPPPAGRPRVRPRRQLPAAGGGRHRSRPPVPAHHDHARGGRRILLTETMVSGGRQRAGDVDHLLADPDPRRDQVALLCRATCSPGASRASRATTRRCLSRRTAACSRDPTSSLFYVKDGRTAHAAAGRAHPRLDHPGARHRGDRGRRSGRARWRSSTAPTRCSSPPRCARSRRWPRSTTTSTPAPPRSLTARARRSRRASPSSCAAEPAPTPLAPMKVLTVIGNRPQFIKAAAVSPLAAPRARGDPGPHRAALRRSPVGGVLRRAGPARARSAARDRPRLA